MPDSNGTLSLEERQKVVNWLKEKAPSPACPFCGTKHWSISNAAICPQVYIPGPLMLGGPTVPLVLVVCETCGFVASFSAVTTGVIPADDPQKEAEKEKPAQEVSIG